VKYIDRLIGVLVLAIAAGLVLPGIVGPLVTIALVLTFCFVVIAVTRYLTHGW
jgi:hypothetical protein